MRLNLYLGRWLKALEWFTQKETEKHAQIPSQQTRFQSHSFSNVLAISYWRNFSNNYRKKQLGLVKDFQQEEI